MSSTMCFTSKGHSTRIAPPFLEKSAGDTKRFELRILFAGLLFVLLFGLFAVPVAGETTMVEVSTFGELQSAISSANGDTTIIIKADITASEPLVLYSGKSITLMSDTEADRKISWASASPATSNLFGNGWVQVAGNLIVSGNASEETVTNLTLEGSTKEENGNSLVYVWCGSFALEDGGILENNCKQANTGSIDNFGAGVFISGGTFTMNGGKIHGCLAKDKGGGVYVSWSGNGVSSFEMTGGSICGNQVHGEGGGGVYISDGVFTMSGGEITENSATHYGGGIYLSGGSASLSGSASVTENSAEMNGGIWVNTDTTFSLTGNAKISGNTAISYHDASEIMTNAAVIQIAGSPTVGPNGVHLGSVTDSENVIHPSYILVTGDLTNTIIENIGGFNENDKLVRWTDEKPNGVSSETFVLSKTYYTLVEDPENKALVVTYNQNPTSITLTFDANGGTGTQSPIIGSSGKSYDLPACTFTAPEGQVFKAWDIDGTEYAAGASYTPTASVTVKAVWMVDDTPSPGSFTINAPVNGVVSWTASEGAAGYTISLRDRTISETEDAGKLLNNKPVGSVTSYDISSLLVEGHSYRVAVCAYNEAGKETWAELEFVFGNCQHTNLVDVDITYNGITKDFPQNAGDGTHYWYVNVVCNDCKEVQQENVKRNAEHNANTLEKNGVCECNYHRYETGLSYTMYAVEDANTYLIPEASGGYHGGSIDKEEEVTVLAEGLGVDGSWSLIQYSVMGTSREKVRFVKSVYLSETSESTNVISINFLPNVGSRNTLEYTVDYCDVFFSEKSTVYNHKLAQVSLGLAAASMGAAGIDYQASVPTTSSHHRAENIEDAYLKLGFSADSISYYYYDKPLGDNSDKIAYSIAEKEIVLDGEKYCLFVVVPRSGNYGGEWVSNFNIGDGPYAEGFYKPAMEILTTLKAELAGVPEDTTVKIWTTGFSRGAAVSNLFAGFLTKDAENLGLKKENIYAYTFATPQGVDTTYAVNADVHTKYDNIFNIVNPSDLVTTVPMTSWGFDRYGKTYYFDYNKDSTLYSEIVKQYIKLTNQYDTVYIPKDLQVPVVTLDLRLSDTFESKSQYADYHYTYLRDLLSLIFYEADGDVGKLLDIPLNLQLLYPKEDVIVAYDKASNYSNFQSESNLAVFTILLDELSRVVPLFINEITHDNDLLLEIINVIYKFISDSSSDENSDRDSDLDIIQKYEYHVKDPILTIGYLHGKSEETSINEIYNYLNLISCFISLYESDSDVLDIPMQHHQEVYMSWMSSGNNIEDLCSDTNYLYQAIQNSVIDVTVVADGDGIVYGTQRVVPNNEVLILAVPDDGHEFIGWYNDDGDLISTEENCLIEVVSSTTFTAKFQHGYTIEYDLNGGTNDLNNPSRYYITDDDIRLNNPTKSFSGNGQYGRYIFLGWTWEGQDKPIKDVVIEAGSSGRKTYTANWGGYIAHPIDNEVTTPDMEIHKIILPTNLGSDYHVEIIPIPSTTLAPAQTQTGTFNPLKGYDINPSQQMRPGSTVTIEFYLETTDLPDFVNPTAVALYHKEGNTWTKLPTTYLHTVSGKHWYSAQTTGFSPFVIGYDVSTSSLPDTDDTSGSSKDTGSGNYAEYPRSVTNGGYVDFGTSPVVKGVMLPKGVNGKVVLIAKSKTPAPEGRDAYSIFEINVDEYPTGEKSVISFTIPLSDLQKKGFTEKDICLYHFDGDVWTKLPTTYTVEGDKVFYQAETTAFSPFAIVYEKDGATSAAVSEIPVEPEKPSDETVSTVPEVPSSSEPQETESPAPVLGMMLGGLGAAVLMRRK